MNYQGNIRDRQTVRTTWISLIGSCFIMVLKFYAYGLTESTAVLSDATESIINVIAAFVAVIVMKAVAEPADEEHPYGHGKLEYFSAAFEGGLIAFASLAIAVEAIRALIRGESLNELGIGTVVMSLSAILNFLLALYLKKIGRGHKSEALLASGEHVMSDVITTVGVIAGLGIIYFVQIPWLDPLIAILVSVHLGYNGYQIVRRSAGALLDELELASLDQLATAFEKHREDWVIDIHQLKVIRSGHFHHIDGHLVVPEFWDVAKTHQFLHRYEELVVSTYPYDGEIAFHVDPCEKRYCSRCRLENCPIRKKDCLGQQTFRADRIIKGPQQDEL